SCIPQLSVAGAANATGLPSETVILAGLVMAGASVSCTLTNCVCVLLLPWLSLKVQVIVWSPWPKGPVTSATPVIGPSQASVAVGAAGSVAEHWAITSGNEAASAAGAVVSCTLTNWVCVLLLP